MWKKIFWHKRKFAHNRPKRNVTDFCIVYTAQAHACCHLAGHDQKGPHIEFL